MYAVTSIPVVNLTRATFRSAELGFLGVVVKTRVQTPLANGPLRNNPLLRAGLFGFALILFLPNRHN